MSIANHTMPLQMPFELYEKIKREAMEKSLRERKNISMTKLIVEVLEKEFAKPEAKEGGF